MGDILSTKGAVPVPWVIMKKVGDILNTVGCSVQWTNIMSTVGDV